MVSGVHKVGEKVEESLWCNDLNLFYQHNDLGIYWQLFYDICEVIPSYTPITYSMKVVHVGSKDACPHKKRESYDA